jgi:hypothetical protein
MHVSGVNAIVGYRSSWNYWVFPGFGSLSGMSSGENHQLNVSERLQRLGRAAGARLEEAVAVSTEQIRRELVAYRVVPEDEHLAAVDEQHRRRLAAILESRAPNAGDLQQAADLARTRARQQVPIETLISAYHIGDQALWGVLVESADEETAGLLPAIASRMMVSLHSLSTVLASAHSEVTRSMQGHRFTLVHRLVDLLADGAGISEAVRIAQFLGLDPHTEWRALIWQPDDDVRHIGHHLQRALGSLPSTVVHAWREGRLVLVSELASWPTVQALATGELTSGWQGIGLARPGLAGAGTSLGDAELALASTTEERRVSDFAEHWLEACVLAHDDSVRTLLERAVATAREHPHLAEAAAALANHELSIAAAAAAMHLHPNSVTYRLGRWRDLSGLDARTVSGSVRSQMAIALAAGAGAAARRMPEPSRSPAEAST